MTGMSFICNIDDKKYIIVMVSMDLEKAFNTVEHEILAEALPLWGSKYRVEMVPIIPKR